MNTLTSMLTQLSHYCQSEKLTISVAESVTSGYIQFLLSRLPDALFIFNGGLTTYNIGQKVKHINIDFIEGMRCNCVAEGIASKMALQAAQLFSSRIGLGITGYANPVPEKNVDELFAYMAISIDNKIVLIKKIYSTHLSAVTIQQHYAETVISSLLSYLQQKGVKS